MRSANATIGSWHGELAVTLGRVGTRTVVRDRRHAGPLQVQRAFYPEPDGTCHLYILHPPGGVVGGDALHVDVGVEPGARALVTTPAAAKFYRSSGATALQAQGLRVAAGGSLEWFPQEAIVFDGARVDMRTRVDLTGDAHFIGWEIVCLGRPAAGERYTCGELRFGFELWRDAAPLWLERGRYRGGDAALSAAWGLHDASVSGTLVCVTEDREAVGAVRERCTEARDGLVAATYADGVLACRYRGASAEAAKQYFTQVWAVLRPRLHGRPAQPPRIWLT